MPKKHNGIKSKASSGASAGTFTKKPLKQLFEERDRTQPGSKEEERATERILEEIFPDTNAH